MSILKQSMPECESINRDNIQNIESDTIQTNMKLERVYQSMADTKI